MYGQKKKMITGSLKVALGDCFSCIGLNSLLDTPFCPTNYRYIPLKKYPFFFQGGRFLPATPFPCRNFIQVSYNILFVCFGHEDPLSLQLLRILESNNANIPYAQLSYNIGFKAQQGKIGKKIYFQSFTRN